MAHKPCDLLRISSVVSLEGDGQITGSSPPPSTRLELVTCGLEEELPVPNEAAEAVLPECPASHSQENACNMRPRSKWTR